MAESNLAAILEKTKQAIIDDESKAKTEYRVRVDMEGAKSVVTAQSSNPMSFDVPVGQRLGLGCSIKQGGVEIGMVPGEMYLASVGSCLGTALAVYADVLEITLDRVTVEVIGHADFRGIFDLAPGIDLGFERVEYHAQILSGAGDDDLLTLAKMADQKSPVLDNVRKGVTVDASYIINGKPVDV